MKWVQRMSASQDSTKLEWDEYVSAFFRESYAVQPWEAFNNLKDLCQETETKNTLSDALKRLLPKALKDDKVLEAIIENIAKKLAEVQGSGGIEEIIEAVPTAINDVVTNQNSNNEDKQQLNSFAKSLSSTCLYKKAKGFAIALGRIKKAARVWEINIENLGDLICPLILLYLPLVFTSKDLCDTNSGMFKVDDNVSQSCTSSLSPLTDIALATLQYFRNVANYKLEGNKIERVKGDNNVYAHFPICPSKNDLLLLLLIYIASSGQQAKETK